MGSTARHLSNQRIGLLRQTNWATPRTETANYQTLNYDKGSSIIQPFSVKNQQNYMNGTGSYMESEDRLVTENAIGLSRLPFKAKMVKGLLADHLVASHQKVTEGTTPFKKTIMPVDNPQIDFSANSGYVYTLAGDTYNDGNANGDGFLLKNSILDKLTMRVDNMGEGLARFFDVEGEWVGNACVLEKYLSGTWVAKPTDVFFNTPALRFKADLTVGWLSKISNICWQSFEYTINNNVGAECITDKINNYTLKTVIDVVIRIKYTDATYAMLAAFQAGTNFALDFYNVDTVADADGELAYTLPKGYLTDNPKVVDGDYFGLELKARIIKPTAGWSTLITFTDLIDGNY